MGSLRCCTCRQRKPGSSNMVHPLSTAVPPPPPPPPPPSSLPHLCLVAVEGDEGHKVTGGVRLSQQPHHSALSVGVGRVGVG